MNVVLVRSICLTLTLTLIQPASKRMHWATPRRHSDLFRAATSAPFNMIPVVNKSLLTVLPGVSCRKYEDNKITNHSER